MGDWDEAEHPRHPAGSPAGRGGEFREMAGSGWLAAVSQRLAPAGALRRDDAPEYRLPEMVSWEAHQADYGDAYDEIEIRQFPDGSSLKMFSHPAQEVATLGLVSADGEQFGNMSDYGPAALRNTQKLWSAVGYPTFLSSDLAGFEQEEGFYGDGSILQVRLPSGEGFGFLPEGRMRWYPGGSYPPIDFEDHREMDRAMRAIEDFAEILETDIDNYQDEQEEE